MAAAPGAVPPGERPRSSPAARANYLWPLGYFVTSQYRETSLAWAVALALVTPLNGVDYWLTDDNDLLPDRVPCPVHRLCPQTRKDDRVMELRNAGNVEELQSYLEDEYESLYTDFVAELKEAYPTF